ncbi:IPT/TIG domain-containing protein [Streptomyces kronopolitis]
MALNRSENRHSASGGQPLSAAAPTVSSVFPTSGSSSGGTSIMVTGSGFTGATAVRFGATPSSFAVNSDTQITALAPAGIGTVQVTVSTPSGTSNQFVTFTYLATVPVLSTVSPSSGPAAGGTPVTLSGSGFTGATVVRFGSVSAPFTVLSPTQISAQAPAGSGTAQVTVTTAGGTSNGVAYTYTPSPVAVLSSVTPSSGPTAGGTTVTLAGTNLASTTTVRFGATPASSFTVVSDTRVTAVAPAGTGTVQVTVTTLGGTSNGLTYTYAATPTLSTASPNQGPVSGGNTVVLTGSNFTGTTSVTFGTTAATFTVLSPTQISAQAPAGSGTAQVTVTTAGGTSNGVAYTYTPSPVAVLSSVTPSSGPTAGGTTVTLAGTNLASTTTVRFGATPASSFTVVSDTRVTAVAPAGTGTVQVTVTTLGGTSNGLTYTYAATPTLSTASPNQGPVSGGNTVVLTGSNFTGTTSVTFGTTAATFTVLSPTQISAQAPASVPGAADVTVTAPGGSTTLPSSYFFVNAPTLAAVAPRSGPLAGGNTVTLTGNHLAEATAVRFGGTTTASFTVVSDSQITAVVPAGVAGPADATVITAGGTSNPVTYTYVAAPVITALAPAQGPTSGGNTLTLTGINFSSATKVLVGSQPVGFTIVSDSHLIADAPPGPLGPVSVTVVSPGGTSAPQIYTRVSPPTI